MHMKILLNTNSEIINDIRRITDDFNIYELNIDSMFDDWMIVLDKYSSLILQLYSCNGIFVNTIFSFLYKLKTEWFTLYHKQLHTKLLQRTRILLEIYNIQVFLYACDRELQEYLDIECISYTIFTDKTLLLSEILLLIRKNKQQHFNF